MLVVDDETGPRDALKVILRPFFTIHSADNAKSALQVLKERHIDLITLDQKLPDRQGIDLLQDIKQDYADIEVIIITGYGSLKSRHGRNSIRCSRIFAQAVQCHRAHHADQPNAGEKAASGLLTIVSENIDVVMGHGTRSDPSLEGLAIELFCHRQVLPRGVTGTIDVTALIPLLSDLLEAKDRQLLNHCSRVSFYASLLANQMNLPLPEQKALALGAFLHDIGKVSLSNYKYAPDEDDCIGNSAYGKEHSEAGARMLLPLGFQAEVGQIVAYHHERFDGVGNPHGLQGAGIPLLARIVAIAQAFDNLTVDMPGHLPLSIDDAIRQVSLQADTHFDPKLTELFVRVVRECKSSLPALAIAKTSPDN